MAITRFRPQIWSAMLLSALEKALVYGAPEVVNREYEGEVAAAGDTVRITSISDPTISDYTPNSTTITPEELHDAQRSLVIDQAKSFAFQVDDVDARQARGDVMPEAMRRAGYKLRDTMDQYIASLYTGVQSANNLGTLTIDSGDDAYNMLVDLGVKLDEANVPTEGRYVIVPSWVHGYLQKNTNFINAEKSADGGAALRNGVIGEAAGFSIRKSNNCPNPTGDDYAVLAGVNSAITFAQQINKVEAYRPEASFSDAVKGLSLYGAKLIRPEAIAVALASRT